MGDYFFDKKKIEAKRKNIKKINRFLTLLNGILCLIVGMTFWSKDITGRVISSSEVQYYGIIGSLLIMVSIIAFWKYVRLRK